MPETVSRVQITKLQIGDKRDNKLGQEKLQNGAKKLQIGAGITNRGKRDYKTGQKDYKLWQRLQIEGREITKRGRDYKSVQNKPNRQINS